MNTARCCHSSSSHRDHARRPASRWRRGMEIAEWALPSATLILLPKCPVCLAMYVALFSGVGLSMAGASHLRTLVVVLCVAVLVGLALKRICRVAAQRPRS